MEMIDSVQVSQSVGFTVDDAATMDAAHESVNLVREGIGQNRLLKMRCFAHILNLVVQEGLKHVEDVCDKVRGLSEKLASSTSLSQDLRDCFVEVRNHFFKRDVCTRWNSTFLMLESYLHKIDAIQLFFLTTDDETVAEFSTNGSDIAKMRQVCELLEVFMDATKISSSEAASVSQSLLMFAEVERQLQHQKCLENQRPLIIAMCNAILQKLKEYFPFLYNETTFLCTYFDPRFKTVLVPPRLNVPAFREHLLQVYQSQSRPGPRHVISIDNLSPLKGRLSSPPIASCHGG
ncbi:hypothetical protein RCL1_002223 [Eukaryota sp. TZLM3-RCL]